MSLNPVENAARDAKPWIERLARVGFAAKGVVYMLIGILAARAAIGAGGRTTGSRGALATLLEQPFGRWMLAVIAAGLFGYAAWRIVEAIEDPGRRGSDAKGLAKRLGGAAKALAYAGLGVQAARLAVRAVASSRGDDQAPRHWTAVAFQQPLGRIAVAVAGAAVVGYGAYQCFNAWRAKLNDDLSLARITAPARRWIIRISRFGIGARGVVFLIIGGYLVRAAIRGNPNEARGVGGALSSVRTWWHGSALLGAVAVGLFAYGIYELINARYRRIRV